MDPSLRESLEETATQHGALVNKNNGIYVQGASYSFAKKLEVAAAYRSALCSQNVISINKIAKFCSVSWTFVDKVRNELVKCGRVCKPSEIRASKDILRGPGAKTLDKFDHFVLLQLMLEEPS